MSARASLPNRRDCELFDFQFGELLFTIAVGRFPDGRPAEVFVDCVRTASGRSANTTDMAFVCRDAAILISLALQHSVPVETIRNGISRLNRGEPATVIGRVLDELCRPAECDADEPPPHLPAPTGGQYIGLSRGAP